MNELLASLKTQVMAFVQGLGMGEMLGLAAAAAVATLIAFVLVKKAAGALKTRRQKAVAEKDLKTWDKLSVLARGGEKGDEAKEEFRNRCALLRRCFGMGEDLIAENRHIAKHLPWVLLVGEPSSGKSSLLEQSDLELTPAVGGESSTILNFWLGGRSVILDLEGRIFFDRWMGGSSAEMKLLASLLAKRHHKRPLSGIILAIPADALLVDDKSLCRRKAIIIAAELRSLTARLGMVLPCRVVVTKLDRVLGFSEYFAGLEESERHKTFCWEPADEGSGFDAAAFGKFWDSTIDALRAGVAPRMLSLHAVGRVRADESRLDRTAGVFLFPEKLDAMRESLEAYLKTILGADEIAGFSGVELSGVNFVSSLQKGGAVDPALAALAGKPADDIPIPADPKLASRPFFIRDFLGRPLFAEGRARFTRREKLRRGASAYAYCAAAVIVGLAWLHAALFDSGAVGSSLADEALYYDMLSDHMRSGSVGYSPLLVSGANGPETAFDKPLAMGTGTGMTRIAFLRSAWSAADTPIAAPPGFKAASFIEYGLTGDLERADRRFLYNQLQTKMVYLPALALTQEAIKRDAEAPLTVERRDAILELLDIADYRKNAGWLDRGHNPLYSKSTLESFLDYLYPGMTDDTVEVLSNYYPKYDRMADRLNASIVLSPAYEAATRIGVSSILSSHERAASYPSGRFQTLRRSFAAAGKLVDNFNTAKALSSVATEFGVRENAENWEKLASDVAAAARDVRLAAEALREYRSAQAAAGKNKAASVSISVSNRLIFEDYVEAVRRDYDALQDHAKEHGANIHLRGGVAAFTEKVLLASCSKAEKAMNDAYAEFGQLVSSVTSDPLFSSEGKDDGSRLAYESFVDLMELSIAPRPGEVASIGEFPAAWSSLTERLKQQEARFSDFISRHGEVKRLAELLPTARKMFESGAAASKAALIERGLEFFPASRLAGSGSAVLATRVAATRPGEGEKTLPQVASSPSLGRPAVKPEFEPARARPWVKSFAMMSSAASGRDLAASMDKSPRWKAVKRIFSSYIREYIRWWGSAVDSLAPGAPGWAEFRSFAGSVKAYEVNGSLISLYDFSAEALEMIPAGVLDKSSEKDAKNAFEKIEARKKLLTVTFNDVAARAASAWAELPESAVEAKREVAEMSAESLAVLCLGDKKIPSGDQGLPWWNAFVALGSERLTGDAVLSLAESLGRRGISLASFPIAKNAPEISDVLGQQDLEEVSNVLADFGIKAQPPGKAASSAAAPGAGLRSPLDLRTAGIDRAFAQSVSSVVEPLLEKAAPVAWTLLIPNAELQASLLKKSGLKIPSALGRFRYLEVSVDGEKRVARTSTFVSGKTPLEVMTGSLTESDLRIGLYRFSDEEELEGEIRPRGGWAALRIWLDPRGQYSAKEGIVWTPFVVRDRMGSSSVMFLGVKFSPAIVAPAQWPTVEMVRKGLRGRR